MPQRHNLSSSCVSKAAEQGLSNVLHLCVNLEFCPIQYFTLNESKSTVNMIAEINLTNETQ